ncbi:MAG: hypothetical protein GC152_08450 [Alphaproteobacteria bacterium]|nr:hypothetical protein [Alphaproteobacteria bacterium]
MLFRIEGPVAVITLDQPDKRNAISANMWRQLPLLVERANSSDAARAIVVTGAEGHFAAGADISEFEKVYETPETAESYTRTMLDGLAALEASAKPTIAEIRGACIGGGMSIALACDFRLADQTARFGITPGKLGLVYSADDTRRLVSAVGIGAAKRLLMTAEIIRAEEARAIGLVDQLAPPDRLLDEVSGLAATIGKNSQWSVRATKRMFRLLGADDTDAAKALLLQAFNGPDFREGYRAFLEKRLPDFPTK